MTDVSSTPNSADTEVSIDEGLGVGVARTTPPSAPTVEEVATLTGVLESIAISPRFEIHNDLDETSKRTLIALAFHDPVRLAALQGAARTAATNVGHSSARVNSINFAIYTRAAAAVRRAIEDEERVIAQRARATAANLRVVEGGRGHRAVIDAGMSPASMLETADPYLNAVGELLLKRRGRMWFDEFHSNYFFDWDGTASDAVVTSRKRSDATDRSIHHWLKCINEVCQAKLNKGVCYDAVSYVCELDRRNEVKEWLLSLEWDGQERLASMLHTAFSCADSEYHSAVAKNWFISMAARIIAPGTKVDTMPVLIGGQGLNKSTAVEVIGGKWYAAATASIDDANFMQEMQGIIALEIPELHSITASRMGSAKIKAVLSNHIDRFRPPYGRSVVEYPRTAVLVGTTNDTGWHHDDTGGRRFWPCEINGRIDLAWLRENREQLFAEARVLYERGVTWWEIPEAPQEQLMEAQRDVHPWEDLFTRKLDAINHTLYDGHNGVEATLSDYSNGSQNEFGSLVTTERIARQFLNIAAQDFGKHSRVISAVMRRVGWKSVLSRPVRGEKLIRHWVRVYPYESPCVTGGHSGDMSSDTADDIPF